MNNWPSWEENRSFSVAFMVLVAFLVIFLWAKTDQSVREASWVGKPAPMEHDVTVNGEAKVTGAPDLATISFGVQTQATTAADAQTQNTVTANALLAKVQALGILPADIQTADYSSYQNMVYDPTKQTSVASGWIVSQQVSVKVHDITQVPNLLQVLGQNGATNISGPDYSLDDQSSVKSQARAQAIADAQMNAQALEKSLGVNFVRVVGYSESTGDTQPIVPLMAMDAAAAPAPATPPQTQAGSVEVDMTVTITYQLAE